MIRQALAIAHKDFLIEAGKKKLFTSLFFLSFILIFLSSFVRLKSPEVKTELGALSLWLILVYIMFQALNRSLAAEEETGCWDGLRLCPVSPKAIFIGKLLYNFGLVMVIELTTFPFYMLFFGLGWNALQLFIPITLAALGFTAVGLLISLLALYNQGRELLANLISLPLYLPALFFGIGMSVDILNGISISDLGTDLLMLGIYDIVFIGVSFIAFDINLD